MPKAW